MKKAILAITLSGIWITFSEFTRNEILFKNYWNEHYKKLGMTFITLPINGILWMVWSFCLAYLIYKLIDKFAFYEAVIITWIAAFVMMWITIYNLQVLPLKLFFFAIPMSIIEILIAALIIKYKK